MMTVKQAALAALHVSGALALGRQMNRRSLVVVTYHGVLPDERDENDFLNGNFVATAAFEWQMAWIARHYAPVSLSAVVRAALGGAPLPPRALAVTFDDGFANNLRYAVPILRRYGIPATVFLTTGHIGVPGAQLWTERLKRAVYLSVHPRVPAVLPDVGEMPLRTGAERAHAARTILGRMKRMEPGRRDGVLLEIERVCGRPELTAAERDRYDFLTWDEVRSMAGQGVEFGSHTVSHPILSTLAPESLDHELRESRRVLEDQLQRESVTFAYPNGQPGDFGAREQRALEAAGYQVSFKLFGGLNPQLADRYALDRVNIIRGMSPAFFDAALSGALRMGKDVKALLRGATGSARIPAAPPR